jgi:hypothetical protein
MQDYNVTKAQELARKEREETEVYVKYLSQHEIKGMPPLSGWPSGVQELMSEQSERGNFFKRNRRSMALYNLP